MENQNQNSENISKGKEIKQLRELRKQISTENKKLLEEYKAAPKEQKKEIIEKIKAGVKRRKELSGQIKSIMETK
jgi:DNA integrity scanning protein DisA with diadenylate cyclase activity